MKKLLLILSILLLTTGAFAGPGASPPPPSDTAYDATSWDGVTGIAPSKNAVRDKFEALAPSGVTDVTHGGTGAATLTDHGVLLGSGTSAITPTAVGATGEVLKGVTGADPVWGYAVSPEVIIASDATVDATYCGRVWNNYAQAADVTVTLQAITANCPFSFIAGTTVAKYYRIDPNASDVLCLDGVCGAAGTYIGVASVAAGNGVSCRSVTTGASAYTWMCYSLQGPWLAQ